MSTKTSMHKQEPFYDTKDGKLHLLRHLTYKEDWEDVEFDDYHLVGNLRYAEIDDITDPRYIHQTSTNNIYCYDAPSKCVGKWNPKGYIRWHLAYSKKLEKSIIERQNRLMVLLKEMEKEKWNPRSVGGKLDFDRRAEADGIVWKEE